MDELIHSQKNILGISDFLESAQNYTQSNFPDLDMSNLFETAISGSISTNFWTNTILDFARTRSQNYTATYDYSSNCDYNS